MPTPASAEGPGWRRALSALAVLLGCAVGAQAAPSGRARNGHLDLYWHDPLDALPFPHRLVGEEVAAAFETLGVEVAWSAAQPALVTSGSELRIVLLGEDRSATTRKRAVIGAVHRDPRARTIWVMLPTLRRALGLHASTSAALREVALLCHALARVIVHEIFHLVAPGQPHVPGSLMQARYGTEDLLAPIRLEPGLRASFLNALRRPHGSLSVAANGSREPAGAALPAEALP